MAVVGAAFLLAVGRALARIHVEHDHLRRSTLVHLVDPLAGQVGKRGKVQRLREIAGVGRYAMLARAEHSVLAVAARRSGLRLPGDERN